MESHFAECDIFAEVKQWQRIFMYIPPCLTSEKYGRQGSTPRSTPTYYPKWTHVCPLSVYYPKMGSDMFLSKTKVMFLWY